MADETLTKLRRQKERIERDRWRAIMGFQNEVAANLLRREIRKAGEEPCA